MGNTTESSVSVWDLLLPLARSRGFIVKFTLGSALLSAIVSILLPVRYTAAASILPPQQSSSGAALLAQLAGGSGQGLSALASSSLGIKSQNDTYVAMFRSRVVEDAIIQRFGLQRTYKVPNLTMARQVFEDRSTVVAGLKDGIIRVSVDARTPQKSADLVNAYVAEFQKLTSTIATTEAGQRRIFFDKQVHDAEDTLASAEQDLKATELKTGFVQPESQSRAMIESAASIQGQITAKQVQLQAISAFATENNPEYVTLQRELGELRQQLAKLTGGSGSENDLFVSKGRVPEASLDYLRKYRELRYREAVFQALATQDQIARLDEAKQGAVFQVIDPAIPPDKRSFPHRTILVLFFTALGFFVACTVVLVRRALANVAADPVEGPKMADVRRALRLKKA